MVTTCAFVYVYIHVPNNSKVLYPFNCILKFIEMAFVIKFILKWN